ncbi:MAG: amino acid adenylation domain-containing protein [Alphaproteobacteria bacterium]|nr:amino acid adenylation domain-containing protein [Alphaproteobacteria bacterium]
MNVVAPFSGQPSPTSPQIQGMLRGEERPDLLVEETLGEIFDAAVAATPGKVAMIEGQRELTYRQVDALATDIARGLVAKGVGPGDVIGLYLPRGIDLLVAQIAITKSGAAWLPFDSETPKDRIAVCLADAKAKGLLTSEDFVERVQGLEFPVWPSTGEICKTTKRVKFTPARKRGQTSASIAYMIYTSGSTGVPKGIAITHRNICHYLRASNSVFELTSQDVMFQGCSVAFDLSMEEIWIPLMVGATLWVVNGETLADTESLPAAMREAGVTAIDTVPTLLALLMGDVPSLRTVIVGGEACPPSLVARFAVGGRRLFNSYGPTETTVVATIAELTPGDDVTIGTPIANHTVYVVDEQMQLVGSNVKGELLIGGPGVAPGYVGRDDLTAQKFIANPFGATALDTILYRTGDAVSIDEHGEILFHGRIDDQVKIRGFRVELGEIESAIADHSSVDHAAVVLRHDSGMDQLVAFMSTRKGSTIDVSDIRAELKKRLPPYMVPARYEVIETVPRLSSGKVDRKTLKLLPLAKADDGMVGQEQPRSPVEAVLLHAARKVFPGNAIPLEGDFFTEIGGHSLLAAQFISIVRKTKGCAAITLQDVYEARNIRAMAKLLEERGANIDQSSLDEQRLVPSRVSRRNRIFCGIAQGLALPFILTLQAAPWLTIFISYALISPDESTAWRDMLLIFTAFMVVSALNFLIAPLAKWLIIGKTKPGVYPLWGTYFYRVWLVHRFTSLAHMKWMQGTPVIRAYMRLFGAKIGKEALISEIDAGAPDLVTIGDHASIGGKVIIANTRVERDLFIIGSVTIGNDVIIGSSCVIENDVTIGNGAEIDDLTSLQAGISIPAFEHWSGSPAKKIGDLDPADLPAPATASKTTRAFQIALYCVMLVILPPIGLLPVVPAFRFMELLDTYVNPLMGGIDYLYYMPLLALSAAAMLVFLTALFMVALRWAILPRVQPGRYSVFSGTYVRKWIVSLATEVMLDTLSSIFATIYMRGWYRLMGARIGRGSEISTNLSGRYDLIDIGEGNFIADDVQLGDEHMRRNWMTLGSIKTGSKVFIGNEAVVPMNYTVESGALIGVKSRPPEGGNVGSAEIWFGSPAIKLPVRQKFSATAASTFEPSLWMKIGRGLFEAFNISLPTAIFISLATYGMLVLNDAVQESEWLWLAVLTVGVVFAVDFVQLLIAVACKWISMGVYKPVVKPMWSWWAMRTEAVAVMYWGMAGKAMLEQMCGTPFLPMAMRLFGVKIGKGVYMDATDITEFDCVTIGDHSAINSGACLQTHLYEDRLMKVGRIWVGQDVTVGAGSTVLYDTHLGDGAKIGPLTLVMKGEELPSDSAWVGSPAQPAAAVSTNENATKLAAIVA